MPLRKSVSRPLVVKASAAVTLATLSLATGVSTASASSSSVSALLASLKVPVVAPKVSVPVVAVPTPTPKATATPKPTATPTPTPKANLLTAAAGAVSSAGTALSSAASTITSVATGTTVSNTSCPVQPATQAFAKLGDKAEYSLAPGGDFETSAGWVLSGGAKIASGNETTGVTTGSKSLQMPAGAIAISPQFCVDDTNPYFRFAYKVDNVGAAGFAAYVIYRDTTGAVTKTQLVSSTALSMTPSAWQASPASPLATIIPLTGAGKAASVQLKFVSTSPSDMASDITTGVLGNNAISGIVSGATGIATQATNIGTGIASNVVNVGVTIDSVMVDPYRRG